MEGFPNCLADAHAGLVGFNHDPTSTAQDLLGVLNLKEKSQVKRLGEASQKLGKKMRGGGSENPIFNGDRR